MRLRGIVAAGMLAGWGATAPAQELVLEAFVETDAPVGTRVEAGGVQTIEWSRRVELRARSFTGEALTEAERAAVRAQGVACGRGTPRGVTSGVEAMGGTFVVRFECAWLQSS